MNRENVLITFVVAIVLEIVMILFLYFSDLGVYNLFVIVLLVITVVSLMIYYKSTQSADSRYESYLKKILKTFDSILVKVIEIPSFEGKRIIRVAGLEDLMDAQAEIRKPITFFEEDNGTSFILLDDNEAYIYVLKKKNVDLLIDEHIRNYKLENRKTDYSELFDEIDKTMIVMINNEKAYKVSPIREKKNKSRGLFNRSNKINDEEIEEL
ncbi:MAG: DUF5305 domain-containing protein [Bacilli bacterium]|nr:DUF5305 domain-containing protein [Bacilli bacterium]